MLPLHKLSNVLFLWSGLFVDGPEECPGFCVLFCGWWRFCLCLILFLFPLLCHQAPNEKGFIYSVCFDRQTLPATCRWDARGASCNLLRGPSSGRWPPGPGWLQGLKYWGCLPGDSCLQKEASCLGGAAAALSSAFLSGCGPCHLEWVE